MKENDWIVGMRNQYAHVNRSLVQQAMARLNFLYSDMDKTTTLFVIMPSKSLVTGISRYTEEGLFADTLEVYLREKGFVLLNLLSKGILLSEDYWPNEGHLTSQGNRKVASEIAMLIKSCEKKDLTP